MTLPTVRDLTRLHGPMRWKALDRAYAHFNHSRFRPTDPVSFVWGFANPDDREIAAWMASALAYGRVASILKGLAELNQRWEGQPYAFVSQASRKEQSKALEGFIYRWTRGPHVLGYLRGYQHLKGVEPVAHQLARHVRPGPGGLRPAMARLVRDLRATGEPDPGHLLSNPDANSACKRQAMWLRWMVRKDQIDPGPWQSLLSPSQLWIPLDTHMFRIARRLNLTHRRQPDAEAARRITATFARHNPEDPLKYDFAITRLGMGYEKPEKA